MSLTVKVTGLEEYLDGGTGKTKIIVAGGPGAGKTRFASFTPRPIYAACEDGMMSVADRRVPYAEVKSEAEMEAFLDLIDNEGRKPADQRRFETVVIDTLDAYERSVIFGYLKRQNKKELDGWEDEGYVSTAMNHVIGRLMRVPFNVVILVHTKDKIVNKQDRTILKLRGDVKNQLPSDFDFVGMLENEFDLVDGKRGLKRFITWEPTPEAEWCKARGGGLTRTPVVFDEYDYQAIWQGIHAQAEALEAGREVQQVEVAQDKVVTPSPGGPVSGAAAAPRQQAPAASAQAPTQAPAQPATHVAPRPSVTAPVPAARKPDLPVSSTKQAVENVQQGLGAQVIQDTAGEFGPAEEAGDGTEPSGADAATPQAAPPAESPSVPSPQTAAPAEGDAQTPVATPDVAESAGTSDEAPADAPQVEQAEIPMDGTVVVRCGQARYPGGEPRQHEGITTGCGKELTVVLAEGKVTAVEGSDENPSLMEIAGMRERAFLHNACYGALRNKLTNQ